MKLSTIAMLFFGTQYKWAGNNPTTGLDCSGLVVECLRSIGKHGKSDMNAQMIFDKFKDVSSVGEIRTDAMLFFGKDYQSITHISIAIDHEFMVEAGGEGRAESDSGYVRVRPIKNRNDYLTSINL